MNLGKVIFGFFVLLAAALNFGFWQGNLDVVAQHNVYELVAALMVSVIATGLKFTDRTHLGTVHLATSLVADLQLFAAALLWAYVDHATNVGVTAQAMIAVVSLSGGALLANVVSVVLLVSETVSLPRR